MADEELNENEGASADAEALEEQVGEEPTAEAAEAVAETPAAEAEEPVAEATVDEPVAEATADVAEDSPAESPTGADAEETASTSSASPKAKRKRLPRPLRPQKTRPTRQKAAERKPMVRLEVPEHERGRRQERQGTVVSDAMEKTIVVRVDTVKAHPRYKKVVRQSAKFHAHDEQGQAKVGDVVRIVETRPLSKTKRWRLAEVVEAAK
jgi:small subunit ribosomal protein S17